MSAYQRMYDAGIIPPFLDRRIKPDGTKMTWAEVMAHVRSLRSVARREAKLRMPTQRELKRAAALGVSPIGFKVAKGA